MSRVLLIGEDELLLRTRAAVLRTADLETDSSATGSALAIQVARPCDLVILCHSVPETLAASLVAAIHTRWPATPVLRIIAVQLHDLPTVDRRVDAVTSAHPERLIERTLELLAVRRTTVSTAPPPADRQTYLRSTPNTLP